MANELIIYLAFLGTSLILNILLLLDSHSTLSNGAIAISKIRRIFFAGIIQSIIYFVEYIFGLNKFFEIRFIAVLIETLLFICNLFYVFCYADLIYTKYKKKLYNWNINRLIFLLPILALFVVEALNIFFPIFFDIEAETFLYVEKPWVYIANVVTILYIVFSAVNDIKEAKENIHYYNLPISLYYMFVVLGIILETVFYDYPFIPIFCAFSIMILYMRVLKRIGYIDSLSGVFNRSQISAFINSLLSRKQKKIVAGIMVDVNKFKEINDTYGHIKGDSAIRTVGEILKETTKQKGVCFRYGGDEFIVILKVDSIEEIEQIISNINKAFDDYNAKKIEEFTLTVAQGYEIYDEKIDSTIAFIEAMDSKMYDNKCQSR